MLVIEGYYKVIYTNNISVDILDLSLRVLNIIMYRLNVLEYVVRYVEINNDI
jgi:hypothetical protein